MARGRHLAAAAIGAALVAGSLACRDTVRAPLRQTSPELQARLVEPPGAMDAAVWRDVKAFYAAREQRFAWGTADAPDESARAALEAIRSVHAHGLDPAAYGADDLATRHAVLSAAATDAEGAGLSDRAAALARFDVQMTAALLDAARDVATGRQAPAVIDSRWNASRTPPDYVALLLSAVSPDASGVRGFLARVRPRHREYAALQEALAGLRAQAERGWPTAPSATLKRGQRDAKVVPRLRERLAVAGFLPETAAAEASMFDAGLEAAVRAFQEHHRLVPSGRLDRATVEAMNVPLETRIMQVTLNLERWRWLPDDLGERHLLVNIPYFHLIAREQGQAVMDIRTVVGTPETETPIFSDRMTHVVFSPFWNIPETIALEETAPAVERDPDYLARNNMEVVDASGQVVPAAQVPWGDEEALRNLSFRQRPGPGNALGHVKFMFPNRHAVYIHDTPADALFRKIGRAFSHGCVRVEEPEKLAEYVLRDQPEWTPERIRAAMGARVPQHVPLTTPIPVHIVYITAWVDERGGLHFEDDVYRYDARQARAWAAPE